MFLRESQHLLLYKHLFLLVRCQTEISKVLYFSDELWKDIILCFFTAQFFTEFMIKVSNVLQRSLMWLCSFSIQQLWKYGVQFNAAFPFISKVTCNLWKASTVTSEIAQSLVLYSICKYFSHLAFNLLASYPHYPLKFSSPGRRQFLAYDLKTQKVIFATAFSDFNYKLEIESLYDESTFLEYVTLVWTSLILAYIGFSLSLQIRTTKEDSWWFCINMLINSWGAQSCYNSRLTLSKRGKVKLKNILRESCLKNRMTRIIKPMSCRYFLFLFSFLHLGDSAMGKKFKNVDFRRAGRQSVFQYAHYFKKLNEDPYGGECY